MTNELELETTSGRSSLLTAQECQRILQIVRSRAKRANLVEEDAEDCAMAFLLHLFLYLQNHPADWSQAKMPDAWLFKCADNWVMKASRSERRKRLREQPLVFETIFSDEDLCVLLEIHSPLPSPEASALHAELIHRILHSVASLAPVQQELFKRHFLEDETVGELAQDSDRTPNAIYQAIWSLRQRLSLLLDRAGLSRQEAWDYLRTSLPCKRAVS